MSLFKIRYLKLFLYLVIVLFLTRQYPLVDYTYISNIAVVLLIYFVWHNKVVTMVSFFALVLFLVSILQNNEASLAMRFAVIIISLIAAYFIKVDVKCVKILFYLTLIQCVFIFVLEYLVMSGTLPVEPTRDYFIDLHLGDIYPLVEPVYKIQFASNALIPFVYMLSYVYNVFPIKYNLFFRAIFLLASVLAGNFAYVLAIIVFHVYLYIIRYLHNDRIFKKRLIGFICTGILVGPLLYGYINKTLKYKRDYSTAIRIEQASFLLEDMSDSPFSLFIGRGLGHTINKKSSFRDYRGNVYFELQAIYFLNQLGAVFILYVLLHYYLSIRNIRNKDLLAVYFCYIVYAFTNPYLLDTNQFIIILTLCSIRNDKLIYENCRHSGYITYKPKS